MNFKNPISRSHALLINGELRDPRRVAQEIMGNFYVIGVDGGSNHAESLGLRPDVIIGDLDSISPALLDTLTQLNIKILKHPTNKDETDLELALSHSLSLNPSRLMFVSGLGGRIDHQLANILILLREDLKDKEVEFFDGVTRIYLLTGVKERAIKGSPGQKFSIIPLSADLVVGSLSGAEWGLSRERLGLGSGRGLSNLFLDNQLKIELLSGSALLVIPD